MLGGQTDNLLLQLLDALCKLILLAGPGLAPQIEQLALAGHGFLHVGVFGPSGELFRQGDGVGAVAFGAKASPARVEFGESLGDDRQIGPRHGLVEANENVACLHAVAVAGAYFADHAAGWMLHLLHVGIDDQRTLGDEGAGDFGRGGPAAKSDGKKSHNDAADEDEPVDRRSGIQRRLCTHPAPPSPGTTFNVRGGAPDAWATRLRISSFGPNCCWRPFPMTRI